MIKLSEAMTGEQSYEARRSASKDAIEGRVRTERRRRWSSEEKLRIVRETLHPGAVAQVVADRHGIGTGLLYTWRKQMLTAAMTGFAAVEVAPAPEIAPLLAASVVTSEPANGMDVAVEVELPNGARVRVGIGASAALLRGVFAALDQR
jgi:transposase